MSALIGSFCAKYITFDPKKYGAVTFDAKSDTKDDAKFEEKLTCGLENNMRNLENFYQSIPKFQKWDFDGVLVSKVENL